MEAENYYEMLGISRDVSSEEISRAFREKAMVMSPDKNLLDPDALRKFRQLTQAYQTLSDPARRQQYDASLPALAPAVENNLDFSLLWQMAVQEYIENSDRYTPAFDALRESVPLALENGLLIVGLDASDPKLPGYLTATTTQIAVRRILTTLYGQQLDYRVITGTSKADWEIIKHAEERVHNKQLDHSARRREVAERAFSEPEEMPEEMPEQQETTTASTPVRDGATIWEDLLEKLVHDWSSLPSHNLPQIRARHIIEQIPNVVHAEKKSRKYGLAEDKIQHNLSRALDRISAQTGADSVVIALEYQRYRTRRTTT